MKKAIVFAVAFVLVWCGTCFAQLGFQPQQRQLGNLGQLGTGTWIPPASSFNPNYNGQEEVYRAVERAQRSWDDKPRSYEIRRRGSGWEVKPKY